MKLAFKDLKQQKFTVDAEPSETIAQVKEKISAEKGWEVSQQKLIYSGKILADANTVESYNIQEKDFIVCMVSKPRPAPSAAKAAPPSTPAVSSTPAAPPPAPQANTTSTVASQPPSTPTPAQTTTTTTTTHVASPPAAAPAANPASFTDPNTLLIGQPSQTAINEMESMGFARAEIDRAMRAAFFNPDRAIEYLLTGIPAHLQTSGGGSRAPPAAAAAAAPTSPQPAAPPPAATGNEPINLFEAAAQAGQGGGARGAATRGAGTPGTGAAATGQAGQLNMEFLRNSPHFQHLRQLVQQQPAMLEPILQQVAEGNPQLAQMIGQNQEQFLQLLSENADVDSIGGMGETGPLPPGATAISVTEEERNAIERLCRLGFSRDAVIQAYFACDKNEELAANFLFDQPDDDQD